MKPNNFFNKILTSLGARALRHKIQNADTELLKKGDMLYCTSDDSTGMEVIIPNEPITNIEEFELILNILSNFDKNETFAGTSLPTVKIKAFSNDKKSIIGYTSAEEFNYRNILSLNCKSEGNFKILISLLELVMYLDSNKVLLKDITIDDFVEAKDNRGFFTNSYYIRFPHKLKIDENLSSMENVKWFLNTISATFGISDLSDFEKDFYFSNKLLGIYKSVFINQEEITFSYIYEVLTEDLKSIAESYINYRDCFYDSKKYFVSPYVLGQKYQNVNKEFLDILLDKNRIYFENEHFLVSYLNETECFLIYKEYNSETLQSFHALAEILNRTERTVRNPFGIKYFIYSSEYDHPIGFAIDKEKVEWYLSNKTSFKEDVILDNKSNILIKVVSMIFEKLKELSYQYNCTFTKGLKLEDIVYSKDDDVIYFKQIYNIGVYDDLSSEIALDEIKLNIVLEILKEATRYQIREGKVILDKNSKILAFSPMVIEEFKKYLLTGNIAVKKFLKGIENTISNYTFDNKESICYYEGYGLNPYKLDICFKDEISDNTDLSILTFEDCGFHIGDSKKKADQLLERLKKIEKFKNSLSKNDFNIINESYKLIYERSIMKNHDMYRLYGILYKKNEAKLYKLAKLEDLYSYDTFDNKQVLDIIIDVFETINAYGPYTKLELISITEDLKLCVQMSDLIYYAVTANSITCNESLYQQTYSFIQRMLNKMGYFDISDNEVFNIIQKLQNIRAGLNTKCSKHNFWYNDEDCCSICYPNSTVIDYQKLGSPLNTTNVFEEYTLIKNGEEYLLRIFNKDLDNREKYITRIEELIKLNFAKEEGKIELYPLKKALNSKGMKVIGYITKPKSLNQNANEFLKSLSNRDRLKCVSNLISFIEKMDDCGITIKHKDFSEIISFNEKNMPIITDAVYISKSSRKIRKNPSVLKFISDNLSSCNVTILNEEFISAIIAAIRNELFSNVLSKLNNIIYDLDNYCQKHNYYYMDGECCLECWGHNTKTYKLNDVKKCEVFSDIGKEAIVYDLGDGMLGKVYRTNECGDFENELDIEKKEELIKALIAKDNLTKTSELNKDFEIVNVRGIILDCHGKFRGIVIEKKSNSKSIKILTDRVQLKKYDITREDAFKILISIGHAIECCHENGLYIGDISYNNILFNIDTKKVYIIDIDSVSLKADENTVFTDVFVDPLAITKDGYAKTSFGADWYCYAILSFYILTLLHPFNGVYLNKDNKPMKMPERKVKKISVLGDHNVKVPAIAISWDFMSDDLKKAFLDIFENDKRYDITKYIESDYARIFVQGKGKDINKKSSVISKKNKSSSKIKVAKYSYKKDTSLNLISNLVKTSKNPEERLIAKGVSIIGNEIYHDSIVASFSKPIKDVHVCDKNTIYAIGEDNSIYFCKGNNVIKNIGTTIAPGTEALAIPYSDEILFVDSNNKFISYLPDVRNTILSHFDFIPQFTLSINSRHGSNDSKKITDYFLNVLKFLSINYNDLKKVTICADLIMDKWLILSSLANVAYVFDPKESKATKVDIPFSKLEKTTSENIIFFNNAIYYPLDGKICSINVFNLNYLEFECDKVFNTSKIEIIKDGFRIYNKNDIYDIGKK